mmetsp:Transcript_12380/g.19036  ORF Transcript_12380/g.19036 Transcript_12380/m.19036 type:complete len:555 (-) Transcript_12380:31-1695(-)
MIGSISFGLFLLQASCLAFPTLLPFPPKSINLWLPQNHHISARRETSLNVRFTRDMTLDTHIPVNEDAVIELIKKRKAARRDQNFAEADALLEQLQKEHSVILDDKTKKWRTIDLSRRRSRTGSQGGKVGPHGHDFVLCPDSGPIVVSLSEKEIHELIAKRMNARKTRNFRIADQIRDELKSQGVYLDDNTRQWRADGKSFVNKKGQSSTNGGPLSQSYFSLNLHEDNVARVTNLLNQRLQLRNERNFEYADSIRDELLEQYDIHINDRLREWSVGGNFGENRRDNRHGRSRSVYVKSPYSANLPFARDEDYVQNRVDERLQARLKGDFDLADEIRQELLADFGVMIQDTINQWSVGGDFGNDAPKNRAEYTWRKGRGDDSLSPKQIIGITKIIAKRVEAKRARNFALADEIRDKLFDRFNVCIDDKACQWYVEENPFKITTRLSEQGDPAATRQEMNMIDDNEAKEPMHLSENVDQVDYSKISTSQIQDNGNGAEEWKHLSEGEEQGDETETSIREKLMLLTVAQLKERLRDHGKKVSGKKEELVDRLLVVVG